MQRVAVLNIVGLTPSLLPHAPRIRAYAEATGGVTPLQPVFPALTCSVQASMTTGQPPGSDPASGSGGHGIVSNGWYDRDTAEVRFWQRSDRLVQGEKVWETARKRNPNFTCANLFWWHNTYSACDIVVQARPIYKADGQKIPDCYTNPPELRDRLQAPPTSEGASWGLGRFPLFRFWGPLADITSSRWIADAAIHIDQTHRPTLSLIYLPHLDYGLQKLGPDHPDIPADVQRIDLVVGDLLDHFAARGVHVVLLSEYGIEPTVPRGAAIEINRVLRREGLLAVREEDGGELVDPGACHAFAVADHQVAHVYHAPEVELPHIPDCQRIEIQHARAGDTVFVAQPGRWFTYDYWRPGANHACAPDFARTVDIHRKPGYDPRELFSNVSSASITWKLLRKKLGFRQLMDVVPLDTDLVRGTHGRTNLPPERSPLLIGTGGQDTPLPCTAVRDVILNTLFNDKAAYAD